MTLVRWAVFVGACSTLAGGALGDMACGGGATGVDLAVAGAGEGGADGRDGGSAVTVRAEGGMAADATAANPDSGGSADAEVDPRTCGAPGRDCLGGECEAGVCQPVVLANIAPLGGITSFAIDETSVYWTSPGPSEGGIVSTNGSVSKCPLAGCAGAPTSLATGQDYPQDIVVSGSTLYWLDYNSASLMRCGVDCNDDATMLYKWPEIWLGAFAVNATQVFLSGANGAGLVEECPSSGCVTPTTLASGQATPNDMAVGAAGLYWIDEGVQAAGRNPTLVDGGVLTCPLGGCDGGPTTLAAGLSYPNSLVVNGATAYWAQGNSVVSCAVTGCNGAPTTIGTLAPNIDSIQGLAVDAANAYFGATYSSGGVFYWGVWKCALGGCPSGATQLYSTSLKSGGSVAEVAVDATRVYFVSADDARILALAK